jgi:hypothetical protein
MIVFVGNFEHSHVLGEDLRHNTLTMATFTFPDTSASMVKYIKQNFKGDRYKFQMELLTLVAAERIHIHNLVELKFGHEAAELKRAKLSFNRLSIPDDEIGKVVQLFQTATKTHSWSGMGKVLQALKVGTHGKTVTKLIELLDVMHTASS